MICPQTEAECKTLWICKLGPPCEPPKPTMEEIERLVDALLYARDEYRDYPHSAATREGAAAARAALLAAIRALSNSTQESE